MISDLFPVSLKKELFRRNKALYLFVQSFHSGKDLPAKTAIFNLNRGVVELILDGRHLGNGILITQRSFILMNWHCIGLGVHGLRVVTHKGISYPVEFVCDSKEGEDIALVKARIPTEKDSPMDYGFFDMNEFLRVWKIPIVLLTRKEKELCVKGGYTNGRVFPSVEVRAPNVSDHSNSVYNNHMGLEIDIGVGGVSGGAVASIEGRLIGILSTFCRNRTHFSTCALFSSAVELISRYCRKDDNSPKR